MIRRLIAVTFLLALPLVSGFAQQKTDFSGTWKLNVEKSDFGMLGGPTSRTEVITHKEPSITNEVTSDVPQQGKQAFTLNYLTDGKETTNTAGQFVTKSTAKWDGANLVVNTKLKFNDTDVDIVSTWVLSADGKTLTISSHIASAMGETDQKLAYEKQDSGAAAPPAKP